MITAHIIYYTNEFNLTTIIWNQPGSHFKFSGELSVLLTGHPFLNGTWNSLRRVGVTGITNSGERGGGSPYSCSLCNFRSVCMLLVTTFELQVTMAWGIGDESKGILSLTQATCGEIVLGEFIGILFKGGLRPPCLTPVWGVSPEDDEVL